MHSTQALPPPYVSPSCLSTPPPAAASPVRGGRSRSHSRRVGLDGGEWPGEAEQRAVETPIERIDAEHDARREHRPLAELPRQRWPRRSSRPTRRARTYRPPPRSNRSSTSPRGRLPPNASGRRAPARVAPPSPQRHATPAAAAEVYVCWASSCSHRSTLGMSKPPRRPRCRQGTRPPRADGQSAVERLVPQLARRPRTRTARRPSRRVDAGSTQVPVRRPSSSAATIGPGRLRPREVAQAGRRLLGTAGGEQREQDVGEVAWPDEPVAARVLEARIALGAAITPPVARSASASRTRSER